MRTCDAAVEILRESKNPAVMWGDAALLHMIAERSGIRGKGSSYRTERYVLKNLTRCPGELVPGLVRGYGHHSARVFWLREEAPKWALDALDGKTPLT